MHATPEAAMQAVIDAANREDWQGAARQCDPDSLALFKEHWLRQFAPDNPHPVTDSLTEYFADIRTLRDLAELEPDEVFARYLAGRSLRRQIRRAAQAGELPPEVLAALDAHPPLQHLPGPIGAVHVGDDGTWRILAGDDFFTWPIGVRVMLPGEG